MKKLLLLLSLTLFVAPAFASAPTKDGQDSSSSSSVAFDIAQLEVNLLRVKSGSPVDLTQKYCRTQQTLLIYASMNNRFDSVQAILKLCPLIDDTNIHGDTALVYACHYGCDSRIIKALIDSGANINHATILQTTPLLCVANYKHWHEKDEKQLQDLLQGAKYLIAAGANINYMSPKGSMPLLIAIDNLYYPFIQLLIDHNVNLDNWISLLKEIPDNLKGMDPKEAKELKDKITKAIKDAVAKKLKMSAQKNSTAKESMSSSNSSIPASSSSARAVDSSQSQSHVADSHAHNVMSIQYEVVKAECDWASDKNPELLQTTLNIYSNKQSPNINKQYSPYKFNALMCMVHFNQVDGVDAILEHHPNLELVDIDGNTALSLACKDHQSLRIIKALIDEGANVSHINKDGETPLMQIAKNQNWPLLNMDEVLQSAKHLLNAGAKIEYVDAQQRKFNALHSAIRCCNPGLVRLLIDNGASLSSLAQLNSQIPLIKRFNN